MRPRFARDRVEASGKAKRLEDFGREGGKVT